MAKRMIKIILVTLLFWGCILFIDWYRVSVSDAHKPVFCIEKENGNYVGLGYSFVSYPHPVSGESEYALYLFGNEISSNLTN